VAEKVSSAALAASAGSRPAAFGAASAAACMSAGLMPDEATAAGEPRAVKGPEPVAAVELGEELPLADAPAEPDIAAMAGRTSLAGGLVAVAAAPEEGAATASAVAA
jgi:hypothetical protein